MPNPWIILAAVLAFMGLGIWGVSESWRADRLAQQLSDEHAALAGKRAEAEAAWAQRLADEVKKRGRAEAELAARAADRAEFLAAQQKEETSHANDPEPQACRPGPLDRALLDSLRQRAAARRGEEPHAAAARSTAPRGLPVPARP